MSYCNQTPFWSPHKPREMVWGDINPPIFDTWYAFMARHQEELINTIYRPSPIIDRLMYTPTGRIPETATEVNMRQQAEYLAEHNRYRFGGKPLAGTRLHWTIMDDIYEPTKPTEPKTMTTVKTFYMVCNANRMEYGQLPGMTNRQRFDNKADAQACALRWAKENTPSDPSFPADYVVLECKPLGIASPGTLPAVWTPARKPRTARTKTNAKRKARK